MYICGRWEGYKRCSNVLFGGDGLLFLVRVDVEGGEQEGQRS